MRPSFELLRLTSSPEYLFHVSQLLLDLRATRDRLRAVELLREATLRMGAEVSTLVTITGGATQGVCHRFLLACDPMWAIEYEQLDWYGNDPWLAYALRHTEPIRGEDIETSTDAQRAIVNLARRFGFASSMIVPIRSEFGPSTHGVLYLGSSGENYFTGGGYLALKLVARSVGAELHDWWLARLKDQLVSDYHISERDLQLLSFEARGMSTKEMARMTGSSFVAINSQFQRINVKLGVRTRRAAVNVVGAVGLLKSTLPTHLEVLGHGAPRLDESRGNCLRRFL